MFCDLNVRLTKNTPVESSLDPIFERLLKFGYKKVAITTEVDESVFVKPKSKECKKKTSGNADPTDALLPPPDLSTLKTKFPKLTFYSRINIVINDSSNIRKFTQCKNLKKYDLISFQPESQIALRSLTTIAEVDIVTYNPENKNYLTFSRKLYKQFVNQNVYFELVYAPAIADSTVRRNLLSLSHTYRAVGKSKNIIVSSGAEKDSYIRGPYDVMNLSGVHFKNHTDIFLKENYSSNLLFGLSEEQSKMSITRNCDRLLLRARKQRRNKATVEMVKVVEDQNVMAMNQTVQKEVS